MTTKTYRQGDVLIQQVARIPSAAARQKPKGRIILALGEATGHHHSVDIEAADWWKGDNGDQFLEVKSRGASVEHQEHAALELPPGKYLVRRQREYTPEAIRNVQD
jgi:hypothetical protein